MKFDANQLASAIKPQLDAIGEIIRDAGLVEGSLKFTHEADGTVKWLLEAEADILRARGGATEEATGKHVSPERLRALADSPLAGLLDMLAPGFRKHLERGGERLKPNARQVGWITDNAERVSKELDVPLEQVKEDAAKIAESALNAPDCGCGEPDCFLGTVQKAFAELA